LNVVDVSYGNPCVIGNSADELWVLTSMHPPNGSAATSPKKSVMYIPLSILTKFSPHFQENKLITIIVFGKEFFDVALSGDQP
jgi:hypothetical protein